MLLFFIRNLLQSIVFFYSDIRSLYQFFYDSTSMLFNYSGSIHMQPFRCSTESKLYQRFFFFFWEGEGEGEGVKNQNNKPPNERGYHDNKLRFLLIKLRLQELHIELGRFGRIRRQRNDNLKNIIFPHFAGLYGACTGEYIIIFFLLDIKKVIFSVV